MDLKFALFVILILITAIFISGASEEGGGCDCSCCEDDKDKDSETTTENKPNYASNSKYQSGQAAAPCVPKTEIANGIDDNCNGQTDEEVCADGIDNNGNGKVDESPPC
jgi:hypothetical protein